jgi:hypothetical protein
MCNLKGYTEGNENREEPTKQIAPETISHPRVNPMAVHTAIVALESKETSKINAEDSEQTYCSRLSLGDRQPIRPGAQSKVTRLAFQSEKVDKSELRPF